MSKAKDISLFDGTLAAHAARDAVAKLAPRKLVRNPVMLVTGVVALVVTLVFIRDAALGRGGLAFTGQIAAWLWFTVLFANFAEAIAEARRRHLAAGEPGGGDRARQLGRAAGQRRRSIHPDGVAADRSHLDGRLDGGALGARPRRARRAADGDAALQYRPIVSTRGAIGVIGVAPEEPDDALASTTEAALQFMIDQAAIAIERTLLVDEAAKAEQARAGERLRAALLSSLSHDLRAPLASIVGAVTGLRTLGARMSKAERSDLLATIEEEAGRLSRFVSNLLDMTKLEAGAIDARHDWIAVGDVVQAAVERARKVAPERAIEIEAAAKLPLIRADAVLLEQVLFNLLDNANKYSNPGSPTRIAALAQAGELQVTVTDEGIGIPRDALTKVFEKFYRVAGSDGRTPGTGLGLSICAGLVKAMGGTIRAESPVATGSRVEALAPTPGGLRRRAASAAGPRSRQRPDLATL